MSGQAEGLHRFRTDGDGQDLIQAQLEAARALARQGDLEQARRLAHAVVQMDPACTDGWLHLAWLAQDQVERKMFLQRVVTLEPGHAWAQGELQRLERSLSRRSPTARSRRVRRLGGIALLVGATLLLVAVALVWGPVQSSLARLLPTATPPVTPTPTRTPAEVAAQFFPQLDAAVADERWDRALEIVAIIQGVDPTGEEVRARARDARLQVGQGLVDAGQAEGALIHFEQALVLFPGDNEAQSWRDVTLAYLAGTKALAVGDWATAAETLARAHDRMPAYPGLRAAVTEAYRKLGTAAAGVEDWTAAIDALSEAHRRSPDDDAVTDLLAAAYRQRGIERQEQADLENARIDLEAALALRPEDAEAKQHYDRVMYLLFPPKRIEINVSTQRFYAWEGDTLVYQFLTSTGLPGQDTATGHFKVQSKIPMAYSSIWRLDMPYWLGIYYVGNIENGIHALPIRPDGTVMWGGLLGQKASYGCIILSTEAAQIIYNWAEVGTEVDIHY